MLFRFSSVAAEWMASCLPWGCPLCEKRDNVEENMSSWRIHEGSHLAKCLECLRRGVCTFSFSRHQDNLVSDITYTEAERFIRIYNTLCLSEKPPHYCSLFSWMFPCVWNATQREAKLDPKLFMKHYLSTFTLKATVVSNFEPQRLSVYWGATRFEVHIPHVDRNHVIRQFPLETKQKRNTNKNEADTISLIRGIIKGKLDTFYSIRCSVSLLALS